MIQKILKWLFILSIAVSCVLGFIFRNEHPHFIWQKIPVFEAVFGFVGCVVFVFLAKTIGKKWLQREEDYYDN